MKLQHGLVALLTVLLCTSLASALPTVGKSQVQSSGIIPKEDTMESAVSKALDTVVKALDTVEVSSLRQKNPASSTLLDALNTKDGKIRDFINLPIEDAITTKLNQLTESKHQKPNHKNKNNNPENSALLDIPNAKDGKIRDFLNLPIEDAITTKLDQLTASKHQKSSHKNKDSNPESSALLDAPNNKDGKISAFLKPIDQLTASKYQKPSLKKTKTNAEILDENVRARRNLDNEMKSMYTMLDNAVEKPQKHSPLSDLKKVVVPMVPEAVKSYVSGIKQLRNSKLSLNSINRGKESLLGKLKKVVSGSASKLAKQSEELIPVVRAENKVESAKVSTDGPLEANLEEVLTNLPLRKNKPDSPDQENRAPRKDIRAPRKDSRISEMPDAPTKENRLFEKLPQLMKN